MNKDINHPFFPLVSSIIKSNNELGVTAGEIILTFDDGPNQVHNVTQNILDILDKYEIKAFFCVLGSSVEHNKDLLISIRKKGHIIVNHSFSHPFPLFKNYNELLSDVERNDRIIGDALNIPDYISEYYRPPYGLITRNIKKIIYNKGYKVANVTIFSVLKVDSEFSPENFHKIVKYYKYRIDMEKRGIVVLHDGNHRGRKIKQDEYIDGKNKVNRSRVPEVLEEFINYYMAKGYKFTTNMK